MARRETPLTLRRRISFGKPGQFALAPFSRFIGIRVVALRPGRCVLEMEMHPHHHNPVGLVHGGALFTLLDTSMGGALRAARRGRSSVAIEIHVRYLQPVISGKVRAEGRVVKRGKSIAVMESVARHGKREVARASGSFYLL